ncbi:MAG: hypothetical protein ACI4CC_03815, partial [Lachnospiraceae bacterium]
MNNKSRSIIVTVIAMVFLALQAGLCAVAYFNPVSRSDSERRELAQFPEKITWEGIKDKTFMDEFESYTLDQFPFREFFRSVKA